MQLNDLPSNTAPTAPSRPADFRPAGNVRWAMPCHEPGWAAKLALSNNGAFAAGQRYEARVHELLLVQFPVSYVRSPWFAFSGSGGARHCQPDGLLLDFRSGSVTIVEIKLYHTERAWWQLEQLYRPVISRAFGPQWRVATAEVCRFYDPSISIPALVRLHADLTKCREDEFNVHIRSA